MAGDHYDTEWTIENLMDSIFKEMKLVNNQANKLLLLQLPVHFIWVHANCGGANDNHKKDPSCVFCRGMLIPNSYTTVVCHKQRLAAVKNAGLCFNCLTHYKVSHCPSKFCCNKGMLGTFIEENMSFYSGLC